MPSPKQAARASEPPPTFIGLVCSLSGWALLEFALQSYHAGLRAHLVSTLMAAYLVFTSTKRMKFSGKYRHLSAAGPGFEHPRSNAAQFGWALLLLTAGAFTGAMILSDSAFLLGVTVVVLAYAPWSRIPLCRERLVAASILMCIGMGLPLLVPHRPVSPFFLPISACLLWLCATLSILGRIARLWRAERDLNMAEASPAVDVSTSQFP